MAFQDPQHESVTDFAQEARHETSAGQAANYTSGTDSARGLLNRPDTFSAGLGGAPDPMQSAIRQKYAGQFERAQDHTNLDALKGAKLDHLRKLDVATQMASQEHQMNFEKEMQRKKMSQQQRMMRGQIVGQVLGIVGAVAGGVAGAPTGVGAVGGAAAGYALGSGVGNAIGSG